MRIFVTRNFARWMRRSGVATQLLATAAFEVDHVELKALRAIAKHYLSLNSAELRTALRAGVLEEIKHDVEPH